MTKDLPKIGASIIVFPYGKAAFCPLAVVAGYTPKEDGSVWLVVFVNGEEWFVNPAVCAEVPGERLYCNLFNQLGEC